MALHQQYLVKSTQKLSNCTHSISQTCPGMGSMNWTLEQEEKKNQAQKQQNDDKLAGGGSKKALQSSQKHHKMHRKHKRQSMVKMEVKNPTNAHNQDHTYVG